MKKNNWKKFWSTSSIILGIATLILSGVIYVSTKELLSPIFMAIIGANSVLVGLYTLK